MPPLLGVVMTIALASFAPSCPAQSEQPPAMRVGLKLKQRDILSVRMVIVQATKGKTERMSLMANSLAHTKWTCKYHIVFTPKYRRKIIYKQLRADIQQIIKDLCKWKGIEIIEGHMMPDHIHLLLFDRAR